MPPKGKKDLSMHQKHHQEQQLEMRKKQLRFHANAGFRASIMNMALEQQNRIGLANQVAGRHGDQNAAQKISEIARIRKQRASEKRLSSARIAFGRKRNYLPTNNSFAPLTPTVQQQPQQQMQSADPSFNVFDPAWNPFLGGVNIEDFGVQGVPMVQQMQQQPQQQQELNIGMQGNLSLDGQAPNTGVQEDISLNGGQGFEMGMETEVNWSDYFDQMIQESAGEGT